MIKHLVKHESIDAARVGIVGDSEGGAIALLGAGAEPTGNPIEYGIIETTIDGQVLEDLGVWINEVARPAELDDLPF